MSWTVGKCGFIFPFLWLGRFWFYLFGFGKRSENFAEICWTDLDQSTPLGFAPRHREFYHQTESAQHQARSEEQEDALHVHQTRLKYKILRWAQKMILVKKALTCIFDPRIWNAFPNSSEIWEPAKKKKKIMIKNKKNTDGPTQYGFIRVIRRPMYRKFCSPICCGLNFLPNSNSLDR